MGAGFLGLLSELLGFGFVAFDVSHVSIKCRVNRLSGVSCLYWFRKSTETGRSFRIDIWVCKLGVDNFAGKVLRGDSIENTLGGICQKMT